MRFPRKSLFAGLSAVALGVAVAMPATFVGASNGASWKPVTQHPLSAGTFHAATAPSSSSWGNQRCFGIYPISGGSSYQQDCYGHDEPAIDPISNVPGSGQDVTWTFRLPTSSPSRSLLDMGPTFWVGATLNDPSSLASRVFSELQFYPDSTLLPQSGNDINTACTQFGFNVNPDPGNWAICDFSWGLYVANGNFFETPAYVGVVDTSTNSQQPLYLHSGDTISVHVFNSGDSNNDAEQVITDLTTGQSGSLIMDSNATTGAGSVANPNTGDGPLTLPYSTNTTNNPMPWGVVDGTPFAFAWEIGHSNIYTHSFQGECVPGQWDCQSYDTSRDGWGAVTPFRLLSVTFGIGGKQVAPQSWATNDSQGGAAEDNLWCGGFGDSQGTTLCGFPYYTYDSLTHTVDFGTTQQPAPLQTTYGGGEAEYAQTPTVPGPLTSVFGSDLLYADTPLTPSPPIP